VTLVIPDVLEAGCATRQALERLASKWRVLVVYALLAGPQRHAGLRRRLPGISQKVLTQTLRAMQDDGLVTRRVLKEGAPQVVEYALTPLGKTLEAPLAAICAWAAQSGSAAGHGAASGADLGHDGQQVAIGVGEERHPLLDAGLVPGDHVRGAPEGHSPGRQRVVGGVDVGHPEVQD
jgi:DNA-binding HxlR family transcriptional regulator